MRQAVWRALCSPFQAVGTVCCAAPAWPLRIADATTSGRAHATWRAFASGAPPRRAAASGAAAPPKAQAAGGAAAAAGGTAAAAPPKLPHSPFEKWYQGFQAAPAITKVLGFAGAIPFIALAPPVAKHLYVVLPHDVIDNSAQFQVGYGACIITFLGAVHWGMAMGSGLSGPIAAKIAQERYLWSVMPSLLAWPLTAMEPGPAAALLATLLAGCYAWDSRATARGYLPYWYMSLRGPLTLLASFGAVLTASYYWHLEYDRLDKLAVEKPTP